MENELLSTITKYGGINKVPEEILISLGYRRVVDNSAEEPVSRLVRNDVEIVEKTLPFSKLEMEVIAHQDQIRCHIGDLRSRLISLNEELNYGRKHIIEPEIPPLPDDATFQDQLDRFEGFSKDPKKYVRSEKRSFVPLDSPLTRLEEAYLELEEPNPLVCRLLQTVQAYMEHLSGCGLEDALPSSIPIAITQSEYGESIERETVNNLLREIEIARSKAMDTPEARDSWLNDGGIDKVIFIEESPNEVWEKVENKEGDDNEILGEFVEMGYISKSDLESCFDGLESDYLYLIPTILEDLGFKEVARGLRERESLEDYETFLSEVSREELPSYRAVQDLTTRIKEVPIEEKRTLGKELKDTKQKLKEEKVLIEGVKQLASPYQIVSEQFVGTLKKIRDIFVWKKSDERTRLYLDANPNRDYDENPGALVGDCTEGYPLPFFRPDTHNIKVAVSNPSNVVGSIYLLETEELGSGTEEGVETGKKVWHLDAIQIPQRADWDSTVRTLLSHLSEAASHKGIDMITVNYGNNLISNFDYIETAIRDYIVEQGCLLVDIHLPRIDMENISSFQGDGSAYALWLNN